MPSWALAAIAAWTTVVSPAGRRRGRPRAGRMGDGRWGGRLRALESIAVIGGTGHEGFGFVLRWASAGYRVIIGSRDPARAREAADRARAAVGPSRRPETVTGLGNAEAASTADIVVLTLPFSAHPEILPPLREHVRGKIVVDTTVPLESFRPPVLRQVPEGSAAERVQALLPEARVVAAFHTVAAAKLAAVATALEQDTLVCGNDAAARETVGALATAIGLRPVDAGPLAAARSLEHVAALVIALNQRHRRTSIGVRFVGL